MNDTDKKRLRLQALTREAINVKGWAVDELALFLRRRTFVVQGWLNGESGGDVIAHDEVTRVPDRFSKEVHENVERRVASWSNELREQHSALRQLSREEEAANFNKRLDANLARAREELQRAEESGSPETQELRERVEELTTWDRIAGARRCFSHKSRNCKTRITELNRLLRIGRRMLSSDAKKVATGGYSHAAHLGVSASYVRDGGDEKFALRDGDLEILLGLPEALKVASEITAWATRILAPGKRARR